MQQIEIYLQKFKDFGLKERLLNESVRKTIKDLFDVDLEEDDVQIQNGVIRINASGSAKSEIFIHKKKIQEQLEKRLEIL